MTNRDMKYKCPICKTEQKYRGVCCNCNENFWNIEHTQKKTNGF